MSQAKILWVQDDFDGPVNGVVEYNGEKLWFARVENPSVVSSTDVPVPETKKEKASTEKSGKEEESDSDDDWDEPADEDIEYTMRSFQLLRLEPSLLQAVTDNHIEYCKATGAPLNHGDPIKPKVKVVSVKATPEDLATVIPKEQESFEVAPKLLGKFTEYKHSIVPSEITGECVATLKQSDFSNYLIPHRIETN